MAPLGRGKNNGSTADALGMLHTTLLHTGAELREALSKGIEKVDAGGQIRDEGTRKAVVDELKRMRADLRDTKNWMVSSVSDDVRQAVTAMRSEVRAVTSAVGDLAEASKPDDSAAEDANEASAELPPAGVLVADAEETHEPAIAPARRDEGDGGGDRGRLPAEQMREVVGAAVREELTVQLQAVAAELHERLEAARGAWLADLETVRREVAAVAAALQEPQGEPDAEVEIPEKHSQLLQQAAQVSSAALLCHRDHWEFITACAGRNPHFRVPPQVGDGGHGRVRADVSGRTLIALLISLFSVKSTTQAGDGACEMATAVYERIEKSLMDLGPEGRPVTIVLDDRVPSAKDSAGTTSTDLDEGDLPGQSMAA